MFCEKCGNRLGDGQMFCPQCGAPVKASQPQPQQPTYQQPTYQQPTYQQPTYQQPTYQQPTYQQPTYQQPTYQQPTYQQPAYQQPGYRQPQQLQPDMPMKWFKFLIYFALIAGAVLNFGQAIMMFTGMQYGNLVDEVYEVCDGLQTIDMIMGVALVAISILQIVARVRLAGFYQNGPQLVNAVYLAVATANLIYVILVSTTLPEEAQEYLDITSGFTSFAVNLAIMSANNTYFKKRAHLFTRQ